MPSSSGRRPGRLVSRRAARREGLRSDGGRAPGSSAADTRTSPASATGSSSCRPTSLDAAVARPGARASSSPTRSTTSPRSRSCRTRGSEPVLTAELGTVARRPCSRRSAPSPGDPVLPGVVGEVFGEPETPAQTEQTPLAPSEPYGAAKAFGDFLSARLPPPLRPVRLLGALLQPRVAAAARAIRDAQDHPRRGRHQARPPDRGRAGRHRRRARLGVREGLRRRRLGNAAGR